MNHIDPSAVHTSSKRNLLRFAKMRAFLPVMISLIVSAQYLTHPVAAQIVDQHSLDVDIDITARTLSDLRVYSERCGLVSAVGLSPSFVSEITPFGVYSKSSLEQFLDKKYQLANALHSPTCHPDMVKDYLGFYGNQLQRLKISLRAFKP